MGAGASAREGSGFYCHRCQTALDHLINGERCPQCESGFVEESANASALAQAVHWLVSEDTSASATEARITRLLDDLREQLISAEGSHGGMAYSLDAPVTPKLEAAPQEVFDCITEVNMDSVAAQLMRQTPQCVICCSDFEVGETLSQLPGCSHLFHQGCINGWLERASNCPICRCDLAEAVGLDRNDTSTASSVLLETDRSQYTTHSVSESASPSGTAYRGFLGASTLGYSQSAALWRTSPRSTIHAATDAGDSPAHTGLHGSEVGGLPGWLQVDTFRHRSLTSAGDSLSPTSSPPSPSRRNTSSVLVGAGSAISSQVRGNGSTAEARAQRPSGG